MPKDSHPDCRLPELLEDSAKSPTTKSPQRAICGRQRHHDRPARGRSASRHDRHRRNCTPARGLSSRAAGAGDRVRGQNGGRGAQGFKMEQTIAIGRPEGQRATAGGKSQVRGLAGMLKSLFMTTNCNTPAGPRCGSGSRLRLASRALVTKKAKRRCTSPFVDQDAAFRVRIQAIGALARRARPNPPGRP